MCPLRKMKPACYIGSAALVLFGIVIARVIM